MKYLTERQRDILNFIRDFQKERGIAPTHREICDRFGFSSYGTVYKHLSLLEKKGLIKRDWNQKRGVELVEKEAAKEAAGVRELPLFGYIADFVEDPPSWLRELERLGVRPLRNENTAIRRVTRRSIWPVSTTSPVSRGRTLRISIVPCPA